VIREKTTVTISVCYINLLLTNNKQGIIDGCADEVIQMLLLLVSHVALLSVLTGRTFYRFTATNRRVCQQFSFIIASVKLAARCDKTNVKQFFGFIFVLSQLCEPLQ